MFSDKEIDEITLTADVEKEEVKRKHIDAWPACVIGLENLLLIVKNPIAKLVISAIIAFGTAIHNRLVEKDK